MSSVSATCGPVSVPEGSDRRAGQSSQSKTIHAGVDGQTGVCQAKMGTGVQGFPREHRWLHEPPGKHPYPITGNYFTDPDGQLANTEEFQDGQSTGTLGEVFIRYVRHDFQIRACSQSISTVVIMYSI